MFTKDETRRYSRHFILPEFGVRGQKRLKAARVLCIGLGGLGSPAAMYLAAAGVGTLGLVDFDTVDLSNLQRQVLHATPDVGQPKLDSALAKLRALNPEVQLVPHPLQLSSLNALDLFAAYDLVLDGTDNYATRYLVNDACVLSGKPNLSASVFRFEGQLSLFAVKGGPCYRCLYPEPPAPGMVPSCGEGGVLGVVPGVLGTLQATEAVKYVSGIGEPLVGRLLLFDALEMRFRTLNIKRDPRCVACGDAPTLKALLDYDVFCGITHNDDVPHLAPGELAERLKRDAGSVQLIDVREPLEREINGLVGARSMPMGELEARVGEIDAHVDAVLVCKVGERSAAAVKKLQQLGFKRVFNLAGGIDAWLEEVDDDEALRY